MHGSHSHAPGQAHTSRHDTNERRMGLAALITGLFMFVEIAGGIISGSLALLADAGHMLTDLGSLSLAWLRAKDACLNNGLNCSRGRRRLCGGLFRKLA